MTRLRPPAWLAATLCALSLAGPAVAAQTDPAVTDRQLVFGSFRSADNARGWADELAARFDRAFHVERVRRRDGDWYRVRSGSLDEVEHAALAARAREEGLDVWTVRGTFDRPDGITASTP